MRRLKRRTHPTANVEATAFPDIRSPGFVPVSTTFPSVVAAEPGEWWERRPAPEAVGSGDDAVAPAPASTGTDAPSGHFLCERRFTAWPYWSGQSGSTPSSMAARWAQ